MGGALCRRWGYVVWWVEFCVRSRVLATHQLKGVCVSVIGIVPVLGVAGEGRASATEVRYTRKMRKAS